MQPVANTALIESRDSVLKRFGRSVASMFKPLGSLLPRARGEAPASARIIRPWRDDVYHTYPTVGLTPSRALAFIQQADAGSPQ